MIQERKNDMASIIKRKKNYSVVYNYVDENGETKQKWETWHTHKEALKRKAEIENQQHTGTFLPPSNQTITEFLYDFVSLYGEKKWGVSMYDSQTALIANYINPIIGDMEVQAVTPRAVDGYIQTLQKTKSVSTKTRKAVTTYVSDKTIEKIIKLLRCAFKQAVRWEIIARNPFDNVILPKTEYAKRDIWTADMIRLALDKCTDSKLYVAMNLSFACSLRMGEILGLTWENVHISDEDIAADNAYVYIDKELTRASKRAIETLGEKDSRGYNTTLFNALNKPFHIFIILNPIRVVGEIVNQVNGNISDFREFFFISHFLSRKNIIELGQSEVALSSCHRLTPPLKIRCRLWTPYC